MSLNDLRTVVPEPVEVIPPNPPQKHYLHRIIAFLQKTQKYSAYGFLTFVGLHVSSVVVAPALGIHAGRCQEFFEMTRAVYLSPLFEYPIIFLASGVHLAAGVATRALRGMTPKKRIKRRESDILIHDARRDDIGLGGLGTIFGLGFKKSCISSHFPSFTPLQVSGYVMALALGYHVYKMRFAPAMIDGDSSLINLNFVTHYLRQSFYGIRGVVLNNTMLALLSWVSFYHMVSGLFKYRRQFSLRAKKIAYTVISLFTGLSFVAATRMRVWELDTGFIGRQFGKYLYVA